MARVKYFKQWKIDTVYTLGNIILTMRSIIMGCITFHDITEYNWRIASNIKPSEEQKNSVADGLGIIALAYVNRDKNAQCWAIYADAEMVGLMLVEDLIEEPSCYHLHEFLIDRNQQKKGYGTAAIKRLQDSLANERKFPRIEVCVHRDNKNARAFYDKSGFVENDFIDESCPWNVMYVYTFPERA